MRSVPWIFGLLAVSATSTATGEGAGGAADSYALAWVRGDGAEDCPSTLELQQEVEGRLGRRVFDSSAARSIEVVVQRDPSASSISRRSEIHIRDASGTTLGRRTLTSNETDCRSLFSSTALAIALVVDPDVPTKSRTDITRPSPLPVNANRPNFVEAERSEAPRSAPTRGSQRLPERFQSGTGTSHGVIPATPTSAQGTSEVRQSTQIVGALLIASQLGPSTQPGIALAVNAWHGPTFGWSLSANYLNQAASKPSGGVAVEVGSTFFDASAKLALLATDRARLVAELGPSVGALHIGVRGAPATGPSERWFVAGRAGLAIQAEFQPKTFLELAGVAVVPFTRDTLFNTAGPTVLYAPAEVGLLGRIGIGTTFP